MSVWTSGEFGSGIDVKSRNDLRRALESGADPNELQPTNSDPKYRNDHEPRTPLEWYVGRQTWWSKDIETLVQFGADPNGGWKSLGKASTPNDESVWRGLRLLDLGADPMKALTSVDPAVIQRLMLDEDFNNALTLAKQSQMKDANDLASPDEYLARRNRGRAM